MLNVEGCLNTEFVMTTRIDDIMSCHLEQGQGYRPRIPKRAMRLATSGLCKDYIRLN